MLPKTHLPEIEWKINNYYSRLKIENKRTIRQKDNN